MPLKCLLFSSDTYLHTPCPIRSPLPQVGHQVCVEALDPPVLRRMSLHALQRIELYTSSVSSLLATYLIMPVSQPQALVFSYCYASSLLSLGGYLKAGFGSKLRVGRL